VVGGTLIIVSLPFLFRALGQWLVWAWHQVFNVMVLDRVLGYVFFPLLLLHLLPGEIGRVIRRHIARQLDKLLSAVLYFFAGLPRLLVALLYTLTGKR
jgi:hypothetical protein